MKRRIRMMRVIIVVLLLLSIICIATPHPTGNVVQISINETEIYTEPEVSDPYENISFPGHHNFSVIFDYKIMFLGYDINETLLRPNDTFEITYYWKALDKIGKDYAVFVHFTDSDGKILFQDDHYPALKTKFWEMATIYNETRQITLPPSIKPQILNINMGWWNHQTDQRLIIQEKNNILAIGKIKIISE